MCAEMGINMLRTEYINSLNRNYLKIKIKKQEAKKVRYQYRIVTENKLEGLLPVSMHATNGEQALYYEISSTQNLSKWFMKEKVNRKWLDNLAAEIQVVMWSLEEYLLDIRNLILNPECIFLDMETEKIKFLYYPYYIEEVQPDMETFLSFLVENVEADEADTVAAVYDIFSMWEKMKEQFTLKNFLTAWEKHKKETEVPIEPVVEAEPSFFIEERAEPKPEKKLDIAELLFGRYRHMKEEVQPCMAMESLEYKAERKPQDGAVYADSDEKGRTTYAEVTPEAEERKLFGNGKQNRKVICLDKLPLVIGKKGSMTDVVLQDASISRMHARFSEENGQLYLEDLNATNGTFKNGVRLAPYEKVEILREDEIGLGKLKFTYR